MGNLFIENENDYDLEKHYYCKCCKELNKYTIEICSTSRRSNVECESLDTSYLLFLNISFNNITFADEYTKLELHPDSEYKFLIVDLDPVSGGGLGRYIFCKYCMSQLGIVCVFHNIYNTYERTFFLSTKKII